MNQKFNKLKIGLLCLLILFGFSIAFPTIAQRDSQDQEKSWSEEKSRQEQSGWRQDLDTFSDMIEDWGDNREVCLERLSSEKNNHEMDEEAEYCNDKGCWSQDIIRLNFKGNNTKENWEMSINGTDAEFTDEQGNKWENINDNQSITYEGVDGTKWESTNHGQKLEYKQKGTEWKDHNFNQTGSYKDDEDSWDYNDSDY
ncbi:MAG: hypothetical protein GF332_00830 [Candidatus Moranbacteria bacterium]|nr:hypothetical protein [Candidatus Moranbacteria bacterium]